MKKFKVIQSTVASLMAVSMIGLSACDLLFGDGPEGDGQTYTVTLNENGGDLVSDLLSYVSGVETTLPDAEKEHYIFDGWYADEDFSGEAIEAIAKNSTGDVEYWAKWTPVTYSVTYYIDDVEYTEGGVTTYTYDEVTNLPAPAKANYSFTGWYDNDALSGNSVMQIAQGEYGNKTYYATWTPDSYKITFNSNGGTILNEISGYSYGVETPLPTPTKDGYAFDGWYEKSDFSGYKWDVITVGETGDKTFYAKWTQTNIIACEGYEEGAFVKIYPNGNSLSKISVSYKPLDGMHAYQPIDSELIREYEGYVRADIVGLAEGAYSLEINVGGTKEYKDVTVTSYDRSGYAHFGTSEGVGAYNNDGTPKAGAYVVYVTEETKNTVSAPWKPSVTGLVNVLNDTYDANAPVIIRIIGRISAWTWQPITYTNADDPANIKGINGLQLPTASKTTTQQELLDGHYNELNESVCAENLAGLTSYISYSSGAYDSCWNDCQIGTSTVTKWPKNVTVEGIGADAEIFQWGMTWKYASSIEVRNLTFTDYTEDACSFEANDNATTPDAFQSQRLWVHNCTFNIGKNYWDVTDEQDKHEGDGATDFKRCSYITVAYNHYIQNHKTGLVGSDDNVTTANVTFHHNYYYKCSSRLPMARVANMHMYNNYYYGSTGTNMSLRAGAYAFVEYCYFENASVPIESRLGTKKLDGYDYLYGYAKVYNCEFIGNPLVENDRIKVVTARDTEVANTNIFNPKFDTDSSYFYYDSANNRSDVTYLITDVSTVPTLVPQLAGVHKSK